ncbi:hypothetical protein HK098_004055 [Nowakowskiella sp. JEL0407]|nr:hypothetical protein HK098_004055 [Nowakowskiella sp. JEL0407]
MLAYQIALCVAFQAECGNEAEALYFRIRANDSSRTVFLDKYSIPQGADWKQCFLDNVGKATFIILLISKATLESFKDTEEADNLLLEWDSAITRYKCGNLKILPVFIMETDEKNFRFSGYPLHSVPAKDCTRSFQELWEEIQKIYGIEIHFSRRFDMEALDKRIDELCSNSSTSTVRISAETQQKLTIFPSSIRNPRMIFVGREKILDDIAFCFADSLKRAAILLHGGPGMGKSTIVTKYISDLKASRITNYTQIFWISLVSEYLFEKTVSQSCRQLSLPQSNDFLEERDTFFAWIAENKSYLVIFDNVDDATIVDSCLGELYGISGHVIITSRNPKVDYHIPLGIENDRIVRMKVSEWTEDTTRTYIASRLPSLLTTTIDTSEEESLNYVLKFMNGYPLVVEQMCSFLTFHPRGSFYKVRQLLQSKDKRIWDQKPVRGVSNYERTLDKTFELIIDLFKQTGQQVACLLLGAIGCVSNKAIPIEDYLLKYLVDVGYDDDIDEVLKILIQVSLVTLDDDNTSVSVHLAIREVIRRTLVHTEYTAVPFGDVAVSVMKKSIPTHSNDMYDPKHLKSGKALLPHISELQNVAESNPELTSLFLASAEFAKYVGSLKFSKSFYETSLTILSDINKTQPNSEVADSMVGLASVLTIQSKYDEARKLFTDGLEIYENFYGTREHVGVARIIHELGLLAESLGNYEEAKKLFTECLEIFEKVYQTREHASVATTLNNLGQIAKNLGNYEEASELFSDCLRIQEKVYGTRDHAFVATTIHNLGQLAKNTGDYGEAKNLYTECLGIYEKVYGTKEHASVAATIHELASVAEDLGDYEEAKKLYTECLVMEENIYGTREHTSIATTIHNLASLEYNLENYEEALSLFSESLTINERTYKGQNHPNIANTLHSLGLTHEKMENIEEAEACYMKSLQLYKSKLGTTDPTYLQVSSALENLMSSRKLKMKSSNVNESNSSLVMSQPWQNLAITSQNTSNLLLFNTYNRYKDFSTYAVISHVWGVERSMFVDLSDVWERASIFEIPTEIPLLPKKLPKSHQVPPRFRPLPRLAKRRTLRPSKGYYTKR